MSKAKIKWGLVKNISSFTYYSNNKYVVKLINTQRLVTEHTKNYTFGNKLFLYAHTLKSSENVIVGYEIKHNDSFSLIVVQNSYILFGSRSIKSHIPKKIYEDGHLNIFKFNINNFLFVLNK